MKDKLEFAEKQFPMLNAMCGETFNPIENFKHKQAHKLTVVKYDDDMLSLLGEFCHWYNSEKSSSIMNSVEHESAKEFLENR